MCFVEIQDFKEWFARDVFQSWLKQAQPGLQPTRKRKKERITPGAMCGRSDGDGRQWRRAGGDEGRGSSSEQQHCIRRGLRRTRVKVVPLNAEHEADHAAEEGADYWEASEEDGEARERITNTITRREDHTHNAKM